MARITTSQRIAISGTAARSTALGLNQRYAITCTADCTIRQGGSAVDAQADTANNWALGKNATIEITVSAAADQYISVIGTTGSLYIARLDGA
ncbi:MAG TPA: hypothetical protein VK607_10715 [Kofleriaceae bacterium]|nr:hypothetical protein [Kofleriaceae bacterium]